MFILILPVLFVYPKYLCKKSNPTRSPVHQCGKQNVPVPHSNMLQSVALSPRHFIQISSPQNGFYSALQRFRHPFKLHVVNPVNQIAPHFTFLCQLNSSQPLIFAQFLYFRIAKCFKENHFYNAFLSKMPAPSLPQAAFMSLALERYAFRSCKDSRNTRNLSTQKNRLLVFP